MRTQTRDTSRYGYAYLSGILRMESGRNIASISRQTGIDEQAMQHFMSQSPWSGPGLIEQIHAEVALRPELQAEAMLLLDESGDDHGNTAWLAQRGNTWGVLAKWIWAR